MNLNVFLSIVTVLGLGYLVYYVFRKRSDEPDLDAVEYTVPSAIEHVKGVIQKETSASVSTYFKYDEDSKKKAQSRKELIKASRRCFHGSYPDKLHMKTRIKQILMDVYDFESNDINAMIPFDSDRKLTVIDKFDIMLYKYRLVYGTEAFNEMVKKYGWFTIRDIILSFVTERDEEGNATKYSDQGYIIYDTDIEKAYQQELSEGLVLSTDDKINLITQRVYQRYKGLGVIDELVDMNIDGIRGGTGGIPESVANLVGSTPSMSIATRRSYDAIRMFYKGVPLHLDFLTFGSESELMRIVNLVYQYAPVGQLNRYNGYKISERADNSRVVSTIPNLTDSPAFFIRKFDPNLREIESWFRPEDNNWEMIRDWLKWCARGGITTAYTGPQGSGKTTVMRAAVKFLYHWYNIRVQEGSAFELWLRITFYWKDILSFKETDLVSMDQSMAVQKKTDATVTFVGEAAEDSTVAQIIKAGSVASLYTWYSHHANTPKDLEASHTNALVATGVITDSDLARKTVIDVLMQNAHTENVEGHRRFERFTQFHPIETTDYPEVNEENAFKAMLSFFHIMREQAVRTTDRKTYTYNNIFEYRESEGGYVACNYPSERILTKIRKNLTKDDRVEFERYLEETFKLEEVA